MNNTLLKVENLKTYFKLDEGTLKAVEGAGFELNQQDTLGIIGESGCGKSVTALSILRIVPPPGITISGNIHFKMEDGKSLDLITLDPNGERIRAIRGKMISMIFQEPMTSLSPVHTIGEQIMEAILLHKTKNKAEARDLTLEMLNQVGISNPSQRMNEYSYQLSGGLRQRAMIAMALSCSPSLLIADEPTTALDVTVQAQILDLIKSLQEQIGMSVLYITHNLGVIAEIADEVAVMYLGRIVEKGRMRALFKNPLHPYTSRLLKSIPRLGKKARKRLDAIRGNVPLPLDPPWQCGFYSRCPEAIDGVCNKEIPALVKLDEDHLVRCFLHSKEKEPRHG